MEVSLKNLIAPTFHKLLNPLLDNCFDEILLTGGRGSTKSSFASLITVYGIMEDWHLNNEHTNAVIIRKIANTLRGTVYNQIVWAIESLGAADRWKCIKSPLECTYIPTGQQILFVGCDEPTKVKGTKFIKGHCKYIWYEEFDQFGGMAEIRNVNQTLARGGVNLILYTFNPPPNLAHWANIEADEDKKNRLRHHSTYLDVNPEWLGKKFINDAEDLKRKNIKAYENEYLGLITGIGGEIFKNINSITLTLDEILLFERIRQGLDFGFTKDPSAFVKLCYQKNKYEITPFDELFLYGCSTRELSEKVNKKCSKYEIIKADSAENRTINTMDTEHCVNVLGCKKGPDSVRHGVKWLSDLNKINIDRKRTPNIYREFTTYELDKDKQGNWINKYPDRDNHTIDAIRYSLDDIILATGWRVPK